MLLFCYPKCSTCKKAENWLKEQNIPYEYRDITLQTPSKKELEKWILESGLPLKKFFNTSGQKYRSENIKEKLEHLTREEALELLTSDGMLMKRPLLIGGSFVLVGFRENEWQLKMKNFQE